MPNVLVSSLNSCEVNCRPRSDVILAGTPNFVIHPDMRAFAHETAVISGIGMASGHRVYRSMIVKRYAIPSDGGSGDAMLDELAGIFLDARPNETFRHHFCCCFLSGM